VREVLGGRSRRLSQAETERRMLATARDLVNRTGLTVSLDHLGFEEIIRAADVSRSAAYRRWPHKELFIVDLVRELAETAAPPTIVDDEIALITSVVESDGEWLATAAGRQRLLAELFRRLAVLDFDVLHRSPGWRTYIALQATFVGLDDGELREQVRAQLAESERRHLGRVAQSWERLCVLFGFRLRPELGTSFDSLAILVSANLRGLFLMALASPWIATQRTSASPFGAGTPDEWSLAAFGIASIASAHLEPDPDVAWDDARLRSLRTALSTWTSSDPARQGPST
jgi:AcrR family transcriptional regulator